MTPLPAPDSQHVEAAKGWCELHDFLEANEELEKVAPRLRAHPSVLEVRWQIYANLEKWDGALEIASPLVEMVPDQPEGWIYRAAGSGSPAQLKHCLGAASPSTPAKTSWSSRSTATGAERRWRNGCGEKRP